jgi:hypothetical protein
MSTDTSERPFLKLACPEVVRFEVDKCFRRIYLNPSSFSTNWLVGIERYAWKSTVNTRSVGSSILSGMHRTPDARRIVLRKWYKDVNTDQYNYARLHMARQGTNESPQEWADRCRALARRITCQCDDPTVQLVHRENAERMLLASYVAGLVGVPD